MTIVVDAGGHLLGLLCVDDNAPISAEIAIGQAGRRSWHREKCLYEENGQ